MVKSGLSFILSHINVNIEKPIRIIKDHYFRRATDKEVIEIKDLLASMNAGPYTFLGGIPYDSVIQEIKDGNHIRYKKKVLPPEKWKYWVIAFEPTNSCIYDLQHAANLIETDLDFGFEILYQYKKQKGKIVGWMMMPPHMREYYSSIEASRSNAVTIETNEIKKIGEIYTLYKGLTKEYQYIEHSIKNFNSLKKIQRTSELISIGYFSIIEALITHPPRLTETLDSIGHQIRNKLVLLRKRFERDINYEAYFEHATEEKIWKTLYDYRSCIAHGSISDFKKSLKILKDAQNVQNFLKENVKCLILYALKEPELITDLKKC